MSFLEHEDPSPKTKHDRPERSSENRHDLRRTGTFGIEPLVPVATHGERHGDVDEEEDHSVTPCSVASALT